MLGLRDSLILILVGRWSAEASTTIASASSCGVEWRTRQTWVRAGDSRAICYLFRVRIIVQQGLFLFNVAWSKDYY